MRKIRTIYSLKELHRLLEEHDEKKKIVIFFDLDQTIVADCDTNSDLDVLIEPQITKDLFAYMMKHNIYFSFITARFYDTVCNSKKRNLPEIRKNIYETLFPIFEELGIDISGYKSKDMHDKYHIIKNDRNISIGMLYHGIIFGGKKGEIIKHFRSECNLDKSHPITIFVDDHDKYLKSVVKHVPNAIVLRREIEEE